MKKNVALILVLLVLFGLCSCKKESVQNDAETTAATTVAPTEETTEPTETLPDIDMEEDFGETEPAINKATIIEKSEGNTSDWISENYETIPAEEVGVAVEEVTAYEKLLQMTGEEQQAFMESFDSVDAFFEWLDTSKAEYEEKNKPIEIGSDGIINIG